MTIYLISYDLNEPNQDYEELFGAIKSFPGYYHLLKSGWLISTTMNAQQVSDLLLNHIDKNDFLLVSRVDDDRQGWLPDGAWTWIRNN